MGVEINGQVRRADGGAPIDKALVRVEPVSGGVAGQVMTDYTGKFQVNGLTPAIYNVSVKAPGFREYQQQVDLSTMTRSHLQIQLIADVVAGSATFPLATLNAAVPSEALKEFELGRKKLLDDKEVDVGIAHLEKAIALYPKFVAAYVLMGAARMESKQWEKAEAALRKAIEIDPKASEALFTLGEAFQRQQKYAEAEREFQNGLKLDPKSPHGHLGLGRVYFAKGDLTKAGPEVAQALQLKPDFAEAYLLAGNLFLRSRNAGSALQMFEQYLKLEPKGAHAAQTREMVEKIKKAMSEKNK